MLLHAVRVGPRLAVPPEAHHPSTRPQPLQLQQATDTGGGMRSSDLDLAFGVMITETLRAVAIAHINSSCPRVTSADAERFHVCVDDCEAPDLPARLVRTNQ